MKVNDKRSYEAPDIEVVELNMESVILIVSGGDYPGGWNNDNM
jgi:hypothetical protein